MRFRLGLALWFATTLQAGNTVVAQFTSGTLHNTSASYVGQSFATPSTGGPWNQITFSFMSDSGPYAIGTAYLFSKELPWGWPHPTWVTPSMLSASLPDLVGVSTGVSNGQFIFPPWVTLRPNTVYYVYVDTLVPARGLSGGDILFGPNSCCTSYFANSASSAYVPPIGGESANFVVTGTVVAAVPTLSTYGLVATAMLLSWFSVKCRAGVLC